MRRNEAPRREAARQPQPDQSTAGGKPVGRFFRVTVNKYAALVVVVLTVSVMLILLVPWSVPFERLRELIGLINA